ncbi:MAG: DUF1569 domain-containing protein [Bacteroidota bacterium]
MDTIFNNHAATEILTRLNNLQPDSKAFWGKMNVAQMLAHLQAPMEVALADKKLKRTFIGFLFGGIAKKKLLNENPFDKNLPTDASFVRKGEHDFAAEKTKTISLLNRLISGGEAALTELPHPFFGKLTDQNWGVLIWKHFDHHLRQFGV